MSHPWVTVVAEVGILITTIEVAADSVGNAREAAIAQARAQGYPRVEAVFTTQVSDRLFRVQMTVSRR